MSIEAIPLNMMLMKHIINATVRRYLAGEETPAGLFDG
jgi:hypothetical protein